jgi:hypothetical protein
MPQSAQAGGLHGQAEEVISFLSSYAQAHIVQQQIAEMEKAEKEKWMASRKAKIETALRHLL